MAHFSRLHTMVIDVRDDVHDQELSLWQGAVGQELARIDRYPEYHGAALAGQEVALLIQRLGDGSSRVHLDIHTDDVDAEVTRLEGLGATRVESVHEWWIMRDPAGLPFCVVPARPDTLTAENAHRWE